MNKANAAIAPAIAIRAQSNPRVKCVQECKESSLAAWSSWAKSSCLQRFIDQLLESPLNALAFRRRLLEQHEEYVLLAVDHEIAAAGAVPFQFAQRSRRRRFGAAWIGPHRKPKPESEAVPGEIEIIPLDPRPGADMVRRHQLEGLGLQIGFSLERPAIEQHLRNAPVVRHGREHTAAGEFYFLEVSRAGVAANPEIPAVRHRQRDQLLLLRIGDVEP